MPHIETTLESKEIFNGHVIRVTYDTVKLENGDTSFREVVHHHGGACVLAVTPDDEVYMVRQYRYALGEEIWELPAGKLEPGEEPFEAMKREQEEETGTWSEQYVFLGEIYPTPGYCNEILRLWACRISGTCRMHLDEDEFLEVERIPLETAYQMALSNQLPDAKTQLGVLRTWALVQAGQL